MLEQSSYLVRDIAAEPEPADDGGRDGIPVVGRGERTDQEQQRDECGERLRGEDDGAVDALQREEGAGTAAGERHLQPVDQRTEAVHCQRPLPACQNTNRPGTTTLRRAAAHRDTGGRRTATPRPRR